MDYFSKQLPSGKWGIYHSNTLLATISCQTICKTILANLASGRKDAPTNDVNALYQMPLLQSKQQATPKYQPLMHRSGRKPNPKRKSQRRKKADRSIKQNRITIDADSA